MQYQTIKSYLDATGIISHNMTNDYMFRYILQKNEKVLRGLISSLLHLDPKTIKKITIRNPINLAEDITGKDFIMDIEVLLNDNELINLEMQVNNKYNWSERSLSYLCRTFDQLYEGQDYLEALPVHHIGFLDFTLFPEYPEFYATYQMLNIKNHHLYSSKFSLSVVDLTQIDMATEEDKAYGIDYWARLFKAKTWEEIKMLAKDNEYLEAAANSLYEANADRMVRERCRARREAERYERTLERDNKLLRENVSNLEECISGLEDRIKELEAQLSQKA
ncbi:MAG: Rpn family recombination-promoting nuclease/putative transposase [Lachnospiraceae bacterium]|nr:Rpn family recombination-promoting nuclease/putative transposase [Lachnospiraceae bacterium]